MSAYRPLWQSQFPDCKCKINGVCLGNENCAATSTAVQIDRSTLGQERPSACSVRRRTGDTSGGLTIGQMAFAAAYWGVDVAVRTGANVATPRQVAEWLRAGRSVQTNIGTKPVLGTTFRSTAGAINHDIYLNEGRDWGEDGYPDEVLVYDSAADGRDRSYHVDQGPSWWPWSLLLKAWAALQPWGESDPRTLGPGRVYAGVGPDTEPHVLLRYGGRKTSPFPDRTRATNPPGPRKIVSVRTRPDRNLAKDIVRFLEPGDLFVAWQRTASGFEKHGSRVWFGNQSGTEWVSAAEITYEGGST